MKCHEWKCAMIITSGDGGFVACMVHAICFAEVYFKCCRSKHNFSASAIKLLSLMQTWFWRREREMEERATNSRNSKFTVIQILYFVHSFWFHLICRAKKAVHCFQPCAKMLILCFCFPLLLSLLSFNFSCLYAAPLVSPSSSANSKYEQTTDLFISFVIVIVIYGLLLPLPLSLDYLCRAHFAT